MTRPRDRRRRRRTASTGRAAAGRSGASSGAARRRGPRTTGSCSRCIILIVVGAPLSPHFLTVGNIANVARQASIVGILGVGMTFVILTAGIDLSVGSILGLRRHRLRRGDGERHAVAAGHRCWRSLVGGVRRRAQRPRHHEGRPPAVHHDPGDARHRPRRDADDRRRQADPRRRRRRATSPGSAAATSLGVPGPAPAVRRASPRSSWFLLRYTPSAGRSTPSATTSRRPACRASRHGSRRSSASYVISGLCAAVSALIVVSRLAAAEPTQGDGLRARCHRDRRHRRHEPVRRRGRRRRHASSAPRSWRR